MLPLRFVFFSILVDICFLFVFYWYFVLSILWCFLWFCLFWYRILFLTMILEFVSRIYVEWLKVELEGLVNTIPYTLSDKTCCKKMHFKSKTRLCFTSFDIIVNVYLNIEIIRTFRLYQISGWQLFLPKCIVDSDEVNKSALHNRDYI